MEQIFIKPEDLTLKISSSYNPDIYDPSRYDAFLDWLCGTREYQKEAIRATTLFLLAWEYSSLADLAKRGYAKNPILGEKYGSERHFLDSLHLSDKLACNIDLATGTGKSYVIYGIAQIMLAEWAIDRVLVLAPSLQIKEWLTKKFKDLASDMRLKSLLPNDAKMKNPRIIWATETIENGDICIENVHSTYKGTKTSIGDSLLENGPRTLVLNDEAHHIYSKADRDVKKWFEFLSDTDYNFKYIVWFSGTPYIENEYFSDVIYRYGISEAMEAGFIKKVDYIKEIEGVDLKDGYKKFQIIHQNHENFREKYALIKPITIFISKDIGHCISDREDILSYLAKETGKKKSELEDKVLIVTSDKAHEKNLEILKTVNESHNPVEWICSVSMLTEGWDVANVIQIVPSEEKAFNSKLLISQVIGRWLRIPEVYKGEDMRVKVLNHIRFWDSIHHLVDEVLEREARIHSYPVDARSEYNFDVHNLVYSRDTHMIDATPKNIYDFKKLKSEWMRLASDEDKDEIEITYQGLDSETDEYKERYEIKRELRSIEETAQEIYNKLLSYDTELKTNYSDDWTIEDLKTLIRKSLKLKPEQTKISKDVGVKILQWFWVVKREWAKNVRYELRPQKIETKNTKELARSGIARISLEKKIAKLFYDEKSLTASDNEDKEVLEYLREEVVWKYVVEVRNSYFFKTPLNLILASRDPEGIFVDMLLKEENAKVIDKWIKSRDKGFYEIEYSWRKWEHQQHEKDFNPDFFIRIWNQTIVIEVKDDTASKEYSRDFFKNIAKYQQAKKHFQDLNSFLKESKIDQSYYFHFASPKDFPTLFRFMRSGNIADYLSTIDEVYERSEDYTTLREVYRFDDSDLKAQFWNHWDTLEENTQIFLRTAEKNYQENIDNTAYSFPLEKLCSAFEYESRIKIFDRLRDNEDLSYEIIEEEQNIWDRGSKQLQDYFELKGNRLDLWTMEYALRKNQTIRKYIKDNFQNSAFFLSSTEIILDHLRAQKYEKISKDVLSKELPNIIFLVRWKYRNETSHGEKVGSKEEFEDLRWLLIYQYGILQKIANLDD